MRAPPNPRKSRIRLIHQTAGHAYKIVTLQKMRRKWNLHHLHKIHRNNTLLTKQKNKSDLTDTPSILEDILNINTAIESHSAKNKPLLIASFPHGCNRSPRVRMLQRNALSRFFISRRRYKLSKFNPGLRNAEKVGNMPDKNGCFHQAHFIRTQASKHADVKINFERRNVIRTTNIPLKQIGNEGPSVLQFNPEQSIRLAEYPSLSMRAADVSRVSCQPVEKNEVVLPSIHYRRKIKRKLDVLHWRLSEKIPRLSIIDYAEVITVSRASPYKTKGLHQLDVEPQSLHEKINSLVEASMLAGSAVSNYTQMMQKLNSISPKRQIPSV